MIEQIQYELDKRKLISDLIIKAFEKVTEQKPGRTQVGKIQDAIYKALNLSKSPTNNALIDSTLKAHGVERYINTGKSYYKNICVKEAYGS